MPDRPIVVVLGKATFRASEQDALRAFGEALYVRGKQLLTTKSKGATEPLRAAYEAAGGTTQYLQAGSTEAFDGRYPVVFFTDKRMQDGLDERMPDWRERAKRFRWQIIHNPKDTEAAGRYVRKLLSELGTPLSDGGTK